MSIDNRTPADTTQATTPTTQPAGENIVNDNPVPGDQRQTEPAVIDPQATGNQ